MQKIWTFRENEAVETEHTDIKAFKAVGKIFEDTEALSKLFGIKVHPALKPQTWQNAGEGHQEEAAHKEVTTLNFNKHRIDKNSAKVLFMSLPASPNLQTLKYVVSAKSYSAFRFTNNGLTHAQLSILIDYMCQDCKPYYNLMTTFITSISLPCH